MIKEFLNMFLTQFSVPGFNQSTSLLTKSTWLKSVDRVGRPTCTDLCTFGRHWTVDRQGRPGLRAELSVCLGRPGRSTVSCQRAKFDRWPLDGRPDRSTGSVFLAFSAANGYIFLGTLNTPFIACFL